MTSTDTGSALLRAILEDPTDDAVRLIYADWLDEQGKEDRAEYIRLQVEYAKLYQHWTEHRAPDRPWQSPRFCRRCQRAEELDGLILSRRFLVPRDGPAPWAPDCPYRLCGLPADYTGPRIEWDWHRGFVCKVRLPLGAFLQHTSTLFSHHPIERVVLTDREPSPYVGPMTCYSWRTSRGSPFTGDDSHPVIPEAIYDLLDGGRWLDPRPSHREWYACPTSDAARTALSRACVAWGRQQAGLPAVAAK